MGAGPEHFVQNGVARILQADGHSVQVESVESKSAFPTEIKVAFELCRQLAERVRASREQASFPLVLSGNCNSSLGTLAGLGSQERLGIVWFDAHGDFNTPETSESSFLDGMGMATATGHCWTKLAATIPGFVPLPDSHVLHVGGRDFDPEEAMLLERSRICVILAERIRRVGMREALAPALESLGAHAEGVYLHLDMDVLDPATTPANEYGARAPDGLSVAQVEEAVRMIGERFLICAACVASYDPKYDESNRTFEAGLRLMKSILAASNR
jgi:arginase